VPPLLLLSDPYTTLTAVSIATPQPNPATVEALLDSTWRLAAGEAARTDALDRKASTVATFASLVAALTATVGIRFLEELETWWAFAMFVVGLAALVASVSYAVRALWPREYLTLSSEYLRRFPTWGEIRKQPEQVRGEMMKTLVETIVREREVNDGKVVWLRRSFLLLVTGLGLIALEGATLGFEELK
jgi:hypothetical protein